MKLRANRLILNSLSELDYNRFVETMLTDERVVPFFYSYQGLTDLEEIRIKAQKDFWAYFVKARKNNLEIWAAYKEDKPKTLVGWCGLVLSELTEKYGDSELQYMIAGVCHGKGIATEMAEATLRHAKDTLNLKRIIATVDIPNIGSIRVLEKLGFDNIGQIEAYGSTEMYLFEKFLNK